MFYSLSSTIFSELSESDILRPMSPGICPKHHPSSATFFFHEHVITVLQLRRGKRLVGKRKKDEVWFDVIDSLPHDDTLRRPGETAATSQCCGLGDDGSSRFKRRRSIDEWTGCGPSGRECGCLPFVFIFYLCQFTLAGGYFRITRTFIVNLLVLWKDYYRLGHDSEQQKRAGCQPHPPHLFFWMLHIPL